MCLLESPFLQDLRLTATFQIVDRQPKPNVFVAILFAEIVGELVKTCAKKKKSSGQYDTLRGVRFPISNPTAVRTLVARSSVGRAVRRARRPGRTGMQGPGEAGENGDEDDRGDVDWPDACENVLRSLSEDVRPARVATARDDGRVAAGVRACLAERVAPRGPPAAGVRATGGPSRRRPDAAAGPDEDAAVVAAASRAQTRCMAVRSAYADGKYYASDATYTSRTVEALSVRRRRQRRTAAADRYTYTVGTVLYDREDGGGACHLHGLVDPRRRVAVDCDRLTSRLPRHRSTVKMYSELRVPDDDDDDRGGGGGAPVLVAHHFQVFRPRRDGPSAAP